MRLLYCSLSLGLLVAVGCKKTPLPEPAVPTPKAAAVSVDGGGDPASPPPAATVPADAPAEAAGATAVGGDSPAISADEPQATSEEIAKFNPPQPMNAYAPRQPGDYQAQLDLYNKVLRTWARNADRPATFKDLMATYNSPKPPEPPAGRKLVYDPRSVTVRLE